MLIRYISDIHMNNGSKIDDFRQSDKLIAFLDDTFSQGGQVRIVGDLCDRENLSDVIEAYKQLIPYLMRCVKIRGNHDDWFYKLEGLYGFTSREFLVENSAVVLHGHQFDWFNRRKRLITSAIIKIVDAVEPIFPNIDNVSLAIRHPDLYVSSAAHFALGYGTDTIIFAHTHKAGHWYRDGVHVYNCGTWAGGKSDYVQFLDGKYIVSSF